MIFNIVNGKPKVGTITVNCPTGTVVTCVQSPYTLSATSVSNKCTFVVPKSGTWTITGTLSGLTRTATAAISAYNGTASVTLVFTTYLYTDGTENVGWTYSHATKESGDVLFAVDGMMRTTSAIDLTNYSTLTVQTIASANSYFQFGYSGSASSTKTALDGSADISYSASKSTFTLNIASVTGSKYIYIQGKPGSSGAPTLKTYQVYLS